MPFPLGIKAAFLLPLVLGADERWVCCLCHMGNVQEVINNSIYTLHSTGGM